MCVCVLSRPLTPVPGNDSPNFIVTACAVFFLLHSSNAISGNSGLSTSLLIWLHFTSKKICFRCATRWNVTLSFVDIFFNARNRWFCAVEPQMARTACERQIDSKRRRMPSRSTSADCIHRCCRCSKSRVCLQLAQASPGVYEAITHTSLQYTADHAFARFVYWLGLIFRTLFRICSIGFTCFPPVNKRLPPHRPMNRVLWSLISSRETADCIRSEFKFQINLFRFSPFAAWNFLQNIS